MEDIWEEIPEVLVHENGTKQNLPDDGENVLASELTSLEGKDNEDVEDMMETFYEDLGSYYSKPFINVRKSNEPPITLAQIDADEKSSSSDHMIVESMGTFLVLQLQRVTTENSSKQIKKQVDKFLIQEVTKEDRLLAFLVDGAKTLTEDFAHTFKKALEQITASRNSSHRSVFVVSGLHKSTPFNPIGPKLSVCSSNGLNFTNGLQEFDTEYEAKLDDATDISHDVQRALILETAKPFEVYRYHIAVLNSLFLNDEFPCPCVKLIVGGSEDLFASIAAGEYFGEDVPTLIINTGSKFTKALTSFIQALKTDTETNSKHEKVLLKAIRDFSVTENAAKDMITELKCNCWKIDVCEAVPSTTTDLIERICSTISKGINPSISFIMDRTQEVGQDLASSYRYEDNSKFLHFPSLGVFPGERKFFDEELQVLFGHGNAKEFEVIQQKMTDNSNKVFFCNEDASANDGKSDAIAKKLYHAVKSRMDWLSLAPYDFAVDRRLLKKEFRDEFYKHCPVLGIKKALKENNVKLAEYLLQSRPVDIYPYVYFNMWKHWYDSPQETKHKISRHFKIINIQERLSKCDSDNLHSEFSAKAINKAISKLSNRLVADLFIEDGRPNIKVFNPIQALMVNRLFNMQLEFVKLLWRYDKRNGLTNGLILWILIKGVLKENIFGDEEFVEQANKLNEMATYFEEAIRKLLDIAQNKKRIAPSDLTRNPVHYKFPALKEKKIFEIAGEVRCDTVLVHPLGRRSLPGDWTRPTVESEYRIKRVFDSPRNKLYFHMFMYVICYFLLAYYTLQTNSKGSTVIKGVTFVLIASLVADEFRQVIENEGTFFSCFKSWWSDPWNKLDFVSMLLYYVGFFLDVSGVPESRILFSTFSFVWCLKFYQFLRAFESLGTYIILIQKMLPHLGNFIVITLVAMIGYGVFMTSILFPSISFNNWNPLLLILFRPYLLLFAETGINAYELSSQTTLFQTKKIATVSEMLVILGMCIFLMLGGVLLINLLIAIFSGIYEDVKEKSELHWVVNGCHLLQEFRKKPILPIPFSFPINLFCIFRWLIGRKTKDYSRSSENWARIEVEHEVVKDCMMKFVKKEADDVDSLQKLQDSVMGHVDERMERSVTEISIRVGASVAETNERVGSSVAELNDRVETSVTTLNNRIDAIEKQNKEIMLLLREFVPSRPTL